MNSREKFEEVFPTPHYIEWSDTHSAYLAIKGSGCDVESLNLYKSKYFGFVKGIQACEASREFVVELPDITINNSRLGVVLHYDDVVKAIEAAGGRVK